MSCHTPSGEAHHDIIAAAALVLARYALHHKLARTDILLADLTARIKPFRLPVLLAATTCQYIWIPRLGTTVGYPPFVVRMILEALGPLHINETYTTLTEATN